MSDAATRLRDWNDGADDVPPTYTYDALEFQQDLRTVLAERDAALAEAARLREALTKISQSTGCVEACPCWQRLRIKARAALAKDQAAREGGG